MQTSSGGRVQGWDDADVEAHLAHQDMIIEQNDLVLEYLAYQHQHTKAFVVLLVALLIWHALAHYLPNARQVNGER